MGEATFHTARLVLRPARLSDLSDLNVVMSDDETMRYWSQEAHSDLAETEAFLARMMARNHLGQDFVMELDGRAVGKAGAYALPEVGFILRRDLWGQGLAREAMMCLIPHIFATTDVPALTADVDPRNLGSLRVLDRLGFRETGRAERTFFLYGEWANSIYLALSRPKAGISGNLNGN
ncbi:MAG: GNAT family N-acetyltransferase [Pseudomonadota bacterium]|nr:GNAT family N-acetyltransferase [Pseudomonadota bacterium]